AVPAARGRDVGQRFEQGKGAIETTSDTGRRDCPVYSFAPPLPGPISEWPWPEGNFLFGSAARFWQTVRVEAVRRPRRTRPMLTFTFECQNEAQFAALQQAAHFLAEMHHLAQNAPARQVLPALEGLALDSGRQFLR